MQSLCCVFLQHATILYKYSIIITSTVCSTFVDHLYSYSQQQSISSNSVCDGACRLEIISTPNKSSYTHSTLIKPMLVQVLKKCEDWDRRNGYFCQRKKSKNKIHLLRWCWNNKLLHWLLLFLVYWLMLARRLCVYNADLKTSYYQNVRLCKRHIVVHHEFGFWRFALLFLGLVTHYHEYWQWKH